MAFLQTVIVVIKNSCYLTIYPAENLKTCGCLKAAGFIKKRNQFGLYEDREAAILKKYSHLKKTDLKKNLKRVL